MNNTRAVISYFIIHMTILSVITINIKICCFSHQRDVSSRSVADVCASVFLLSSSSAIDSSSSLVTTQPVTEILVKINSSN